MPANLLSLNDDILLLVVSYLSQPEALRFSLTAKEVYPIAIRQMPTIAGCQNAQHLTKIHAYMLSDIPNRAHRLVDLAIAHHRVESPATAILVKDLLAEAVNLRKLLLEPFTSLLNLEPRVGDALAALQRLQYIWLIEIWNEHCLSTFPRMRSNPSRVQLTENHNWGYSTFFSCLASFTNLRTLRFADVVEFSSESEPEPSGSWTKVPQVQCLILSDCVVPWSNFVDSLPNVRSVEIKEVTPAIEIGRKFWPDLRRLMLHESTDFRIVEAVCPVHWLVISVPLDEYDEDEKPDGEWELEPLNAVRAASPMVFCFTVSCSVDTAFLEHLIETGLQRLTLVDVNFLPDDDPDDPDGMEWLATNLSFLDLVPVTG
ncbi:hypothetical protein A0H81_14269 [Grifola frondosa]|uniref:F-box domain-containing protein n=1 Tax=Grifola frondosa TaxID=5627 RepID=A0A1C7LN52_GRIFR|nr:hypothetical protein A0H81_14269 [Grifola frondosa]